MFDERFKLALECIRHGLYDDADKLFRQCYIYYSSLGQDTIDNFNKAKMCAEYLNGKK